MKKIFLLMGIAISILTISCNLFSPYGKKVKINDFLEVYIKGDSTTETDAKKLGNYLADLWKENKNTKSVQLIKEGNGYTVKMVADEKVLKAEPELESAFGLIRVMIEENVFKGSKVKLVLTNDKFKDIKTYDGNDMATSNNATATDGDSTSQAKDSANKR